MAIEKTVKLQIDAEEAIKRLEAVEKQLADISTTAKQTEKGTTALATGFRGIGLAWKAIGIGAVITALQFLADKFSANQEILDKFNVASAVFGDILTQIGTVVISVVKGLGLLGKAVGKVLKGELKEAGEIAKQSFDGVKEAVVGNNESFSDFIKNAKEAAKETVKFAKDLVNLRKEVKLAEANQRQLQLTYQKDAELQRQLRDDISLTIEQRIAANTKLGEILEKQFNEEKALAQKRIDLAQMEFDRNKTNVDLEVALINAKTELVDLEERITSQSSEQKRNLTMLEKEHADAIKATIDEQKKLADQQEAEAQKQTELEQKEALERIKIANGERDAKIEAAQGLLTAIGQLSGEGSKIAKATALTNILIDTAQAVAGAIKAAQAVPFPGNLVAITTGVTAALTGIASAKKILAKANVPGSSGQDATAQVDIPQTGGIGGLIPNIDAISPPDISQQPVQAFVVENDISNSQALQEELEIQATL
tara:strand:+ start:34 stop:1482 length:1449 start_codon:yes stop_codon:yes gene_type:complete